MFREFAAVVVGIAGATQSTNGMMNRKRRSFHYFRPSVSETVRLYNGRRCRPKGNLDYILSSGLTMRESTLDQINPRIKSLALARGANTLDKKNRGSNPWLLLVGAALRIVRPVATQWSSAG